MTNIVNTAESRELQLERELARVLESLLSDVPWIAARGQAVVRLGSGGMDTRADLVAEVPGKRGRLVRLVVECRGELKPSSLPAVVHQLRSIRLPEKGELVPVVASRHVSARVAEMCAQLGVSWFDLAGNCRISAPGIYIERSGRTPVARPPRPGADLSSWAAARVLRVLLAPEWAGKRWTQRELEAETSNPTQPGWPTTPASLGLINKVVRHLKEEAFIRDLPERGFLVSDPVRLLEAWREVYRYRDHGREGHFTLLQGGKLAAALSELSTRVRGGALYASFSAADLQAPSVRHLRTWLYVHPMAVPEVREVLEAKPVESGENLVLLEPADDGVFYRHDDKPGRLGCTNPVQTYLDLRHGAGRGEEAAEAILEQRLKPAWRDAGLL